MKTIFKCDLFICDNPDVTFNTAMPEYYRLMGAIDNTSENNYGYGHKHIICEKNNNLLLCNAHNYATEILTGIKIPIRGVGLVRGLERGKLSTPYYGKVKIEVKKYIYPSYIVENVSAEELRKYALEHTDKDGTYNKYKKELEDLIANSIKSYEEIPVSEYVMEESLSDVYNDIKRTRSK